MSTHTYSIIRDNNYEWTGYADDVYYTRCNCGVESGMTHFTIESAHREPQHTKKLNSNGYIGAPTWDGRIIDKTGR